jgi:hypothetical protein
MFKRTVFGLTLAPAFALGVALTAYAVTGWHGNASATHNSVPTRCDSTLAVHVERPDAVRLYELTTRRPAQLAPPTVPAAPCANAQERN